MTARESVLVVDDSPEVRLVVTAILKTRFSVKAVSNCKEALAAVSESDFALILLDIELPDGDGFKLCAQLRLLEKLRSTPIVFLSGKNQVTDKILGLSLGADDYLVKPIDPLELQARIEARLRRTSESRAQQAELRVGKLKAILPMQKAFIVFDDSEVLLDLTTMEFKLLCFFLRHVDHVLTRQQILNSVWTNLNVSDRTVDTHIYTLRQKLGSLAAHIQSIPRVGYRFSQIETKSAA